jgi:hypothetical protein
MSWSSSVTNHSSVPSGLPLQSPSPSYNHCLRRSKHFRCLNTPSNSDGSIFFDHLLANEEDYRKDGVLTDFAIQELVDANKDEELAELFEAVAEKDASEWYRNSFQL